MDEKFIKRWKSGLACSTGQFGPTPAPLDSSVSAPAKTASLRSIFFGDDSFLHVQHERSVPIPGYDAPALPIKPTRDPSLSLIALGGIEPEGPVMVEVPLVQNNGTFSVANVLVSRRVGFAARYAHHGAVEHRAPFLRALDLLRRAGVHLLPVPAQRVDESLRFDLHSRNEIDDLINEHQLDALVSDSHSAAFHSACWNGYPKLGEPLGDGATLWFYGARWSKSSLAVLVQGYRSACYLNDAQPKH